MYKFKISMDNNCTAASLKGIRNPSFIQPPTRKNEENNLRA